MHSLEESVYQMHKYNEKSKRLKKVQFCVHTLLCQLFIVVFGMMSCFLNNRKHLVGDTPSDQSAVAIATQ